MTNEIVTVTDVWIPGLTDLDRFLGFYFSVRVYFLVFVSIEKIYQTLETVFHPISRSPRICDQMKYSTAHRIISVSTIFSVFGNRMKHFARV